MKLLLARITAAFALAALAAPALPCGDSEHKTTTAEKKVEKPAVAAAKKDGKAAKAAAATRNDQVKTASAQPAK
ncbi:hypothetical protein [Anaeromyxobacter oryzae]|uniref:Lipoprotein n=1 Tax=Anaeromyxobacter oryzae TaxID=2918170 RepID=A0ABM7WNJ8_9BACT|nr:hypothetical protein [Anaeromyxobacter oryzae]BDG01037.1 hypothetical protein AMOR_00330 [Anaeromyxobacter oryzae]